MTISTTTRKAGPFLGDGVVVTFYFAFKVFSINDVVVTKADSLGNESVLLLTTNYTVSLNIDQNLTPGGSVTLLIAPAVGEKITLTSGIAMTQLLEITNAGGFYPASLNDSLDKVVTLIQQVSERVDRSFVSPLTWGQSVNDYLASLIATGGAVIIPVPTTQGGTGKTSLTDLAFLGTPTAPTAAARTNTTQLATTAFCLSNGIYAQNISSPVAFTMTSANFGQALRMNSATPVTVVLPLSTSGINGIVTVYNQGLGAVTLATQGGEIIDAFGSLTLSSVTLLNSESIQLISIGIGKYKEVISNSSSSAIKSILAQPPIRQTVLSGPVDINGFSSFGGATGSTTVTATGSLKVTAASGGDANRTNTLTNPSWTGLSTNGSMYLYVDLDVNGTATTGSTTLAPIYQFGGTYSVANLQHTFNIQEMTMKVGNGASATQVNRVFVGEVTVAGAVVTAIVWYGLMGKYDSGQITTLPGVSTAVSLNHNLGLTQIMESPILILHCNSTDNGYAVGDILYNAVTTNGSYGVPIPLTITSNKAIQFSSSTSLFASNPKAGGTITALTAAKWNYRVIVNRGW